MRLHKIKRKSNIQMSESLFVGLLLASVGGFLESYSFISRDGVFANCQTGNLVLLSLYLVKGDLPHIISYLIPIAAFITGVVLTELIRGFTAASRLHWRQYIILLEAVLLAVPGFLVSGRYNIAATTLIAFCCSMQVESFRKVKGSVYATTMCTGNLRSGTYQLFRFLSGRDIDALKRAGTYFAVIAIFMAGAVAGGLTTQLWGEKAVWIACAILFLTFIVMFIESEDNAANRPL